MKCIASPFGWRRAISAMGRLAGFWLVVGGTVLAAPLTDSYRVQATDILVIEVVNEPQLAAKEFRVSSNGEVSYPFIGAIKAAGRTTVEIQEELKRLLEADYLVNAQVMVQVKEFRRQQVSVLGQVVKAGLVDIPPERKMTVIEAITTAGGLTRLARTGNIELRREGLKEPMRFSLEELRNPNKSVHVEPGDVIFVDESRF